MRKGKCVTNKLADGTSIKGVHRPQVFVIGGPNGAGKSTIANRFVGGYLALGEFVNADVIARGLAGFNPDIAALQAGRIMLARVRELAAARVDFSFETTLASRSFAPWLAGLVKEGYEFHLIYSWLRSPQMAVSRVKRRVSEGGHAVPEETIVMRYARSAFNLINRYIPVATEWRAYDNSGKDPRLIAVGGSDGTTEVSLPRVWRQIQEVADAEKLARDE